MAKRTNQQRRALGRKVALSCLAALAPGCHFLAGVDALELRDDARALWRWSPQQGESAEQVRAVGADGSIAYAAGTFGGALQIDEELTLQASSDEDGFVLKLDASGKPIDAFALADAGWVRPLALSGSLLAGHFAGQLRLPGSDAVLASGDEQEALFLIDLAAPEKLALAVGGGFTSPEKIAVARDGNGNVIVGGGFHGAMSPPGCPTFITESQLNLFLFKLDASGSCTWSFENRTTELQMIESVAVDLGGSFVVAGEFTGDIAFDEQAVLSATGGIDFFMARFAPDGSPVWSRSFGDSSQRRQSSARVAVHPFGNSALAGLFEGEIDFGDGPIDSGQGHDIFAAKFDPKGNHLWTRQLQVQRAPCETITCDLDKIDIAFDNQGNLILAGHFAGTIDLGNGVTLTSEEDSVDLFLVKLNADGELLWSGRFGDASDQCTFPHCSVDLAVDGDSNVLLGGFFEGSVDFGGTTGAALATGGRDPFVVKFSP